MEEKSASWLFSLLAHRHEPIPIIDTLVFLGNGSHIYLTNKANGEVWETQSKILSIFLSNLASVEGPQSKICCAVVTGSSCRYVRKTEVKALAKQKFSLSDQVQVLINKKNLVLNSSIVVDVMYISGRYKSQVCLKSTGLEKLENPFLKSNIKDISGTIIKSIEVENIGKLLKLNLEFLSDSNGEVFLHRVGQCIVMTDSKEVRVSTGDELSSLIKKYKLIKSKNLFEKKNETSFTKDISIISIDSLEEEQEKQDEIFLAVPDTANSYRSAPKQDREKRRTLSNRIKSFDFLRGGRKTTVMVNSNYKKSTLIENEEKHEDSWDFGAMNVNFLEMISRKVIREKLARPISPTYEEIKQKMRQINEKFSFKPYAIRIIDSNSDPQLKLATDKIRISLEKSTKINSLKQPCLAQKRKLASSGLARPMYKSIRGNRLTN